MGRTYVSFSRATLESAVSFLFPHLKKKNFHLFLKQVIFKNNLIYLLLAVLVDFSLVVVSRGYSLGAGPRF